MGFARPLGIFSLMAFTAALPAAAQTPVIGDLMKAAEAGDLAKVKAFLAADTSLATAKDPLGRTALHKAGTKEVASALIAVNADLNAVAGFGQTPLWEAASDGRMGAVEVLLSAGAKADAIARDGSTALHRAAAFNEGAIVQQLIAARADLTLKDERGRTALAMAVGNCKTVPVKLLLDAGSDAGAQDGEGHSLLERAASCRANEGKGAIQAALRAALAAQ